MTFLFCGMIGGLIGYLIGYSKAMRYCSKQLDEVLIKPLEKKFK